MPNHYSNLYYASLHEINGYIPEINTDKFIVYTDGACPNNGNSKARSSIGVHFSEKNSIKIEDVSKLLNVPNPTNNVAELTAIKEALLSIEEYNKRE